MIKETNIDLVRGMANTFLHLPIEKTKFYPAIVAHPFTDSGITGINTEDGCRMVNLCESEEDLKFWQEKVKEVIDKSDLFGIFFMISKPYRFGFLKHILDFISVEDMSTVLGQNWNLVEFSNKDANMTVNQLLKLFKQAIPEKLMDADELKKFNKLPDKIKIYRGLTSYNKNNVRALSWTTKKSVAEWFANRFQQGDGIVYSATIDKKYVFAYFDGRNEDEVIVDPAKLEDLKEL